MHFYMAPMEGITGYIFRDTYQQFFGNIDKYYTPFIAPSKKRGLKTKEVNDIIIENNKNINLVPQILTNKADDFIMCTEKLIDYGYDVVNINLGCPSETVASKYKGSGFLSLTDELDHFLEDIFEHTKVKISIKTRIGRFSPDEFYEILSIYNKYPLEELIIHPRVQKDYYKNKPNLDMYEYASKNSKNKLCYNGDIFTKQDYNFITDRFKDVDTIMLGRGIIANPQLIDMINYNDNVDYKKLKDFIFEIERKYLEILSGQKDVLYKMKEIWAYMGNYLSNDKTNKSVRKAQRLNEFNDAISILFNTL